MSKKETGVGYSPDQIAEMKAALAENDFTRTISVSHTLELDPEETELFMLAKRIFCKYWEGNLSQLGINRMMKNFSNDHPVKYLEKVDAEHFGEAVARIISDKEQFEMAVAYFVKLFSVPITGGIASYCLSIGKTLDESTDEDICLALGKMADVINEELIKVLMLGQQAPELFRVSVKFAAHEDYNSSVPTNFDEINFKEKWSHFRTRLGAPLLFSQLSDDETASIDDARSIFGTADDETELMYIGLRDAFAQELTDTDRIIYYLREQGCNGRTIAKRLGYKSRSTVSKRLKVMKERFDRFVKTVEADIQEA